MNTFPLDQQQLPSSSETRQGFGGSNGSKRHAINYGVSSRNNNVNGKCD